MSAFGEMTEEEMAKKEEERFLRTMNKSKPLGTSKAQSKNSVPAWKQAEIEKQKKRGREKEKRGRRKSSQNDKDVGRSKARTRRRQ